MFRKLTVLTIFLIFSSYNFLDSLYKSSSGKEALKEFVLQYKRPITILEICDGSEIYCEDIINDPRIDSTLVILLTDDTTNEINDLISKNPKNVIVLKPNPLDFDILKKFTTCEQPDLTLIHDVPIDKFKRDNYSTFVDISLQLGSYLVMDASESTYLNRFMPLESLIQSINNNNGRFFVFLRGNPIFKSSRWTTKTEDTSKSSTTTKPCSSVMYNVISSFDQKYFDKSYFILNSETKLCDKYSERFDWVKGINLVTFVMLSGIYPSFNVILQQIMSWNSLNHNDLVMSNIIIKGIDLYPIDRADKRRNFQINDAIQFLETAFKDINILENPDTVIDNYFNKIRQYSYNNNKKN